jgi:NAD(P)-dependent dehydrogenase (short-subunit alcohol dehydrogenase family)
VTFGCASLRSLRQESSPNTTDRIRIFRSTRSECSGLQNDAAPPTVWILAHTDRTEAALDELRVEIEADGGEVLAIRCDVSEPDEVEAAVAKTVERFGRVDCAFNNAGVENKAALVHEITLDEWDRILDINLRGTFVCMQHEIAQMLRQGGGVVVNISRA